ncbi:MAG: alanine racemase [Nitrospinota bacterium]
MHPIPGPTRARVDLDAIAANAQEVCRRAGEGRQLLAVVKADAYGHGAVEVARAALKGGALMLGVARAAEGEELRRAGVAAPILVMGAPLPADFGRVADLRLEQAVVDPEGALALARAARAAGARVAVHLKVDTGMGRLGVRPGEALEVARRLAREEGLLFRGLMTHLARADEEDARPTRAQLAAFAELAGALRQEGLLPPLLHCANSAGCLNFPDAPGNLVRVGIALYGVAPGPERRERPALRPALRWESALVQVKEVGAGEPIGYGGTYRRSSPGRVGIVAAGYGDGCDRSLSNRADLLVGGRRAPVVGLISMDMLAVDLTHLPSAAAGEPVVLLGRQGEEEVGAAELAARAGTIPYEVFCRIGARVPRVFVRGGEVVCWRYLGMDLAREDGGSEAEGGPGG